MSSTIVSVGRSRPSRNSNANTEDPDDDNNSAVSSPNNNEELGQGDAFIPEEKVDQSSTKKTRSPKKKAKALLQEVKQDALEMADIINDTGMKRVDSCEILHLTFHQCARDGNEEMMERLISSTANVKRKINKHDEEGLSPLHYAARYNHFNLVKMLHQSGADVNDIDEEGATPLHFAARYKRMRLKIEDKDYDEDQTDEFAPVVDYESTVSNSVILYLVKVGNADVNVGDIYGSTPLHFASMRGNEIACKELLNCRKIKIEVV